MLDLNEVAMDAWIAFVNEHNEMMADMSGPARSAWAKLEGYAARFALIQHIVRESTGI